MASPFLSQIKKTLSPRTPLRKLFSPKSPLMRLKSPFKGNPLRKSPHLQKPSNVSCTPRRLFDEDVPLSVKVPTIRHILTLEPNINSLLESGIDEKRFYVLGKGSFGTVILSSLKGKKVAVKIVKNNHEQRTMNRELNALILSHPNVVEVLQVIYNMKKPFGIVVMEPWSPITLQSAIEESIQINFEDNIRFLVGACHALAYCHEVGIVHLDVKPKNILIDLKEMKSKLCDFGNSCNLKSTLMLPHIQGTVAYIAPELLKGKSVTEKCDVYSLGITMWQILHKENPYIGFENHVIIYQVVAKHYRPKTTIHPDSKGFVKLYEACWSDNPVSRPNIGAVKSALLSMI